MLTSFNWGNKLWRKATGINLHNFGALFTSIRNLEAEKPNSSWLVILTEKEPGSNRNWSFPYSFTKPSWQRSGPSGLRYPWRFPGNTNRWSLKWPEDTLMVWKISHWRVLVKRRLQSQFNDVSWFENNIIWPSIRCIEENIAISWATMCSIIGKWWRYYTNNMAYNTL